MTNAQTMLTVRVSQLRDITPTVREFTLQLRHAAPAWSCGSHIQVRAPVHNAGSAASDYLLRHYSLVPCEAHDALRIAVKQVQPGRGGSRAMWALRLGDTLSISQPRNHFSLDLQAPAYLLIAGGIGITPLVQMAHDLCQRKAAVRMVYAARTREEFAYAQTLREMLGDRLTLIEGAGFNAEAAMADLPIDGQAYVCGPSGLLNAVQFAWQQAKRSATLLRFETFGSSGDQGAPFEVRLPRHAMRYEVPAGQSILESMEQRGIKAMFGCRKGECGLCALDVMALEGEIEHRDVFLSAHEKQTNTRMCVCVSRVRGSITLDSAYRPDAQPLLST